MEHTERRARAICASENEVWEEASQSERGRWLEEARNRDLMDEITQLRADLAAERELADRLAAELEYARPWLFDVTGFPEFKMTEVYLALSAHATRRNK